MQKERLSDVFKSVCGNFENIYPERDALEMKNDNHNHIELQVNDIGSSKCNVGKDVNKSRELALYVKHNFVDDFSICPLRNSKPIDVTNSDSDNKICHLDALFKSFKDFFIFEGTDESDIESIFELRSGANKINVLEVNKDISAEEESEGCILEHKSITHSKSENLVSVKNPCTVQGNHFGTEVTTSSVNAETMEKTVLEITEKIGNDSKVKLYEGSNPLEIEEVSQDTAVPNISPLTISQTVTVDSDVVRESQTNKEVIEEEFSCTVKQVSEFANENHECIACNVKSPEVSENYNLKVIEQFTNTTPDHDIEIPDEGNKLSVKGRVFIMVNNIETDIHEAVRSGDVSMLRQLLGRGADPNEPDWGGKGDPPIVQAALNQNISIVRVLCEAGCDVNLTSVRGETALHMAVSRRPVNLPLVTTLVAAGCNANVQDKLRGCSPLHCVSGFADDEPLVFQKLLAVTDVNLRDHRQSTVLHRVAATSSNLAWIKQLLELGADPSLQNDRGETALCVALERGWVEGALALVEGGTDLSRTNLYRETVLHVAARHDQADVVAALLRHHANVNAQDLAGNTALHLAAGRGYNNTVRQLLSCPALDLDTYNSDNATPLTCAVESGFISVVQMLVKAEEVDLQPAIDVAKQGYRRLSQPEMCQLLTNELARRQRPHII